MFFCGKDKYEKKKKEYEALGSVGCFLSFACVDEFLWLFNRAVPRLRVWNGMEWDGMEQNGMEWNEKK